MRPFAGLVTIDVRMLGNKLVPESHQNALYADSTSLTSSVRLSRFVRASVLCTYASASSRVKNALSARSTGRSNGVTVLLVQMP
jgi:hypothetical protein